MSLRARVLVALLVLVAVGLVASDLATYQALRTFLVAKVDSQINSALHPAVDWISHGTVSNGAGGVHFDSAPTYVEVRDSSNKVLATANSGWFGQPPSSTPRMPSMFPSAPSCGDQFCTSSATFGVAAVKQGGPDYRVHVWTLPGQVGTVAIAMPLSDVADTLGGLLFIEGLVTLGVLGGAGALGFFLVRLGLRPLNEIELTAEAIAAGDLSQRVRRAEVRTEIGRLGIALNAMLGQIESAFAQKQASENRLRQFLADASHELRTPLTSIRGYAELFRRGARDRPEDLSKVMLRIEEEGKRMGVLVDELLLLARLDQGRPLEHKPVNMATIVREGTEGARAVEPDRPLELISAGSVVVTGDALRLRQVVDNLLSNVRTHTPRGTSARVTLAAADGRAILEVEDQGPGLVGADRDQLFNRFYRADPSRSRDAGGMGLGLSIVDAIVRAHGGSVNALDRKPAGATFRIELPLRNSRSKRKAMPGDAESSTSAAA
jgi:two-component system, OmpR family, sensor kinase